MKRLLYYPHSIPHPCPLYDKLLIVPGLRRNRDRALDALPDHDLEHQITSYSSTSFLPGIALVVITCITEARQLRIAVQITSQFISPSPVSNT